MYILLLRFSQNRAEAAQFMEGHNSWLKAGFDEGIFLLAGSLQPGLGGVILAHNISLADLESRVQADPFVAEDVVSAEILEVEVSKVDEGLHFLLNLGTHKPGKAVNKALES